MTALRVAGIVYLVLRIGFGAGAVVTLLHFARHGELPMTPWGFRSARQPTMRPNTAVQGELDGA